MMERPYVYLCGSIAGESGALARGWRDEAERLLHPEFDVLNPLRGKDEPDVYTWETMDYTDAEIIQRDLNDIKRSRAVLRMYDRPSEGSAHEFFFAHRMLGLPTLLVAPGYLDMKELPIWLRGHTTKLVQTLPEAVQYLKHFWLYPHETPTL